MKTVAVVALVALVACARPVDVPEPDQRPVAILVLVENMSFDRVTVYVVTSPTTARPIGRCDAASVCPMSVPVDLTPIVRAAGLLRLAYRPIAASSRTLYAVGEIRPPIPGEVAVATIHNVAALTHLKLRAA